MKSKISSLSRSEDFKKLLNGKKISNPYSTIFFKKISSKNNKLLNASIVTKRKIGNAVKRNRIKRRFNQILNDAIKKLNMNLNYSYLFIAKKYKQDHKNENCASQCAFNYWKSIFSKTLAHAFL